jgi:uncharacterized protein YkwD
VAAVSESDAPLYALCGAADEGLARVAAQIVAHELAGRSPLESAQLKSRMRRAGVAYMWPRIWLLAGAADSEDVLARMKRWQNGKRHAGVLRCGIARGRDPKRGVLIAAVQADVLADLAALPTQARRGQWMRLDAQMRVPAKQAKVVLLPPRGVPRKVLTSMSPGGRVRSRFALDQAGRWLVQVVATTASGPTPVIEAPVFVEVKPRLAEQQALTRGAAGARDDQALLGWLDGVRKQAGLRVLVRDAALDRLARAHSEHMIRNDHVAHRLGAGSAADRLIAAGLAAKSIGENVARAATAERAHLALYGSPSHRATMLFPAFDRVGLAAVRGPKGKLWVTQVLASGLRHPNDP